MKELPRDGKPRKAQLFASGLEGFGPSRFRPVEEQPAGRRIHGNLLCGVKSHAPQCPGTYGMFDARRRLIYIGKAKNLRTRLLCYFREQSRDPKAGRIIENTRHLIWEEIGDEFAALLRELELIQRFRPRFNVLGIPGQQRHHFICLGKSPAPYLYVTTRPTGTEVGIYGPFARRAQSEDAIRRLNDYFRLRDCPQSIAMNFGNQGELIDGERNAKCLRFELNTCAGPCVRGCTRSEYNDGVQGAKRFLDGVDRSFLKLLKQQMHEAARNLEYERAMSLRDKLASIQWLDDRLGLLRKARSKSSLIYPLAGADGRTRWYLIHRGEVRRVCYQPAVETASSVRDILTEAFSDHPIPAPSNTSSVDSVLLVSGWFRRYAAEREKLLTRAAAELKCKAA